MSFNQSMDMTPGSALGQTQTNTSLAMFQLEEEEESSDEFGDIGGEGMLSPSVRGKGDAGRHNDCFLFRFKRKGVELADKLIPDFELIHMFSRRVGDSYYSDLTSISVTPVAKRGLGRHFTFDFLAPSFEEHKRGDDVRKDASFYGDVRFDYK